MRKWILVAAVLSGACSESSVTDPDAVKSIFPTRVGMQIESVNLHVSETSPRLVIAQVRGILPHGCAHPGPIEQFPFRNGVAVTITVLGTQDGSCSPEARAYEQDIPLVGPYGSGTYTVHVNLVTRTIEL